MPSDIPPPWDIYAQELFHHRHGYPLWAPNPARAQWDVEIADVGWLNEGTFLHLFRSTLPGGAEHQPHELLPEDYVPFVPRESTLFRSPESITQPVLYSRTIKNVSVSGGASMNAPPLGGSASGNIGFQCAEDRGALLLLSPNGSATYMPSRRKVTQYMREYLDKWLLLANDTLDLPLNEQDIYFVTGVTKTSRWGVAAFYGSQRGVHGSVSCDFTALGSANIEVSISRLSAPGIWHKTGPPHARRRSDASPLLASAPTEPRYSHDNSSPPSVVGTESSTSLSPSSAAGPDLPTWASSRAYGAESSSSVPALVVPQASPSTPDKPNQCIFFHYYKAKRRRTKFFLRRFEARAGPHELPPPDPDDSYGSSDVLEEDSGGDSDSETVSGISKPYDPVNAALDYILENSEAEIAIASDMDLYALFQDQDFPVDVAEQLAQLKPHVDIDENYVGTFDVDMSFKQERVGEQSDEAPNVQRATSASNAPPGPDIPDSPHDSDTPPLESPASGGPTISPRRKPPVNPRNELATHAGAIENPTRHFGSITTLTYSADGRYLASGAEDTYITVRDVRNDTVVRHFTAHEDTVSALAFSPTCTLLASASSLGPIKLWDVEALHRELQTIDVGNKAMRSLAFTPDGSKLLGGARDGTFSIWDAVSFELLATAQYDGEVTFIIFSADGRMMATGGTERVCRVWEVANLDIGAPKLVLAGHQSTVSSASFSSDGRYIVTGSCDFGCCIWSTEDGRALVELREHTGPVWSVCFSPDGTRVVSGSSDSTVKVWDARTGERVLSLEAHDGGINAVAYSPDGTYVASASSDDTVRLWKFTQDGTLVKTYNEHDDFVTSMQFSPDSKTIASGSHDGTVYVRPL